MGAAAEFRVERHVIAVAVSEPGVADAILRRLALAGYLARSYREASAGGSADRVAADLLIVDDDARTRTRPEADQLLLAVTTFGSPPSTLAGVADYVRLPFSMRELVARVDGVLVRASRERQIAHPRPTAAMQHGDLTIDLAARTVRRAGAVVDLTPREFDLLAYMAQRPGRAVSRDDLLEHVWGRRDAGDGSTVNVHMRRLRAKIELDPSDPQILSTLWGVGYRYDDPGTFQPR